MVRRTAARRCGISIGCVAVVVVAVLVSAVSVTGAAWPWPGAWASGASEADAVGPVSLAEGSLPVVKEHRYRMSAKIRPLLLFWIGKDNVGGARVRWRANGDGDRGYDLLIGSDPKRAPREINRWGFILEESHGREASILGVIRKSNADSLDAAKADVASESTGGFVWKMIQGRSDGVQSIATVTSTRVNTDYSYRDLNRLLDALVRFPGPPKVKKVAIPAGGRPGFLAALADLIHDTVETTRRNGRAPGKKALPYAYYGYQYDLVRTSARLRQNATYGGRTYPRLVDAEFEVRERGDNWVESFTLALGLDGSLAEVPVFVSYQPKWWLKADMVLDERESF